MKQQVVVNHLSPPEVKIALFRSLFRGRDDVYPRRFENRKTGKSGYSPVCANEWVRGICEKPRIKCTDCPHQRFLPVTDEVIRCHLSGLDDHGRDFVMGMYPMLLDETCFFLAADFDKTTWTEDARAILETCERLHLPAALERSRSGNGGHVWIFFDEPVPASLARKLGAHILTETMEHRPDIGLDSYDRFFPNQDTMPQAGFGNLIALPLQKRPREVGNSVFLDEDLNPPEDQWKFLSSIRRMTRLEVEEVVRRAQIKGHVVGVRFVEQGEDGADESLWAAPWSQWRAEAPIIGSLPENLELVLGNEIFIAKETLSPQLRNRLIRLAAFQNPEFYKAQAMRLATYDKPRVVACANDYPRHIGLPRGCFDDLCKLLSDLEIKYTVRDERELGAPLLVTFQGELRHDQKIAAEAMLAHDTGVLSATTAFGKTVVAAWLVAKRAVNTLVLVHRRQLQEQWVDRLSTFLGLAAREIGRVGGGRNKPTGIIDIAVIQSLVRKGLVNASIGNYGHVIVDECHHLSAYSFELVVRQAKAKFVTGLSATVTRKDGHHPIVFMQCGPVRHRVNPKEQAAGRPFQHTVMVRPTDFRPLRPADPDVRAQFQDLYRELISDEQRNQIICGEVIQAVRDGRSPLVLTERNDHLDSLASRIAPEVKHLIILRGGMSRNQLQALKAQLAAPANEERVVLATGRYIGEGFDDGRLDTLFLTLPVSWHGTIAQYVGRLHRLYDGKREVRVYDYADLNVPMLSRMFDRRCRGYEAIGYTIQLPGSAVPGWPAEVPLPVDPQWKSQYAASVRRLVRDGVDLSLASLFVHVAKVPDLNAEGDARARSATEAFLYRRLETLPVSAGQFRLNAELPIPFDGWGRMEVDLLGADAQIAIELDGGQHLDNPEAYRRDRRKDALLQEYGFHVLRFLCEDVGTRLDEVLDSIIRALSHRAQSKGYALRYRPHSSMSLKVL
jgi:superfamily II DNA or RNA helicase/very-short-patch-repair endonuclease